jgi:hypothetical protein
VIPKASCEECAKITKSFEQSVARDMLHAHRTQLGYRTRHKHERPTHFPLDFHMGDKVERRLIPVGSLPQVPVIMPIFDSPLMLQRKEPTGPVVYRMWTCSVSQTNPDQKQRIEAIKTADVNSISISLKINLNDFMRMLAKIAHCHVVSFYGDKVREKSILPDFILGKNNNPHYVVGSCGTPIFQAIDRPEIGWLSEDGIFDGGDRRFLTVKIELLRYLYRTSDYASIPLPAYWVVVCQANDDIVESVLGSVARKGH